MAVSKMKKLCVVCASGEGGDTAADELIKRLMWLRCANVVKRRRSPDDETDVPDEKIAEAERLAAGFDRDAAAIESALSALRPMREDRTGLFGKPVRASESDFNTESGAYKEAVGIAARVAALKAELGGLSAEENRAGAVIASVEPWLGLDFPLDEDGTEYSKLSLGVLPATADVDFIRAALAQKTGSDEFELDEISASETGRCVALLSYSALNDSLLSALSGFGFNRLDFSPECTPGTDNSAAALKGRAEASIESCAGRRREIGAEMKELAGKCRMLELASDVANTAAGAQRAKTLLCRTWYTTILTAWVPSGAVERVSGELERFEGSADRAVWYEFTDPEPDETPPVLLLNNRFAAPFESVVGLYSLPAYGTFDPTFIMSMFYFVIFGFMLADTVYGLLLAIGGFIAVKKLNMGAGLKRLVTLFAICGVSCAVAGVLFGSYLGDLPQAFMRGMFGVELPTPYLWFDMVNDPITFLIVSFAIGALHLFTGMGIQFYILCREGRVFDAIFDIGSWYVLFVGIGLAVLLPPYGVYVALAGVLMLVLTQGRAEKNPVMKLLKGIMSLYSVVNYISDLLSYSRIMALGLASAVIAQVVNLFATMGGNSPVGWIMMPVVVIAGHAINLSINLLGAFVHDSRLQYIEFFGKFFTDGGTPFAPVQPELKYTELSLTENKVQNQ